MLLSPTVGKPTAISSGEKSCLKRATMVSSVTRVPGTRTLPSASYASGRGCGRRSNCITGRLLPQVYREGDAARSAEILGVALRHGVGRIACTLPEGRRTRLIREHQAGDAFGAHP